MGDKMIGNTYEDCFASLSKNKHRCAILTEKKCEGCKFYKTETELRQQQRDAKARLMRIGKYDTYADKYNFSAK